MKWRPCATGATLSRLLKGFIFVLAVKLVILGSLLFDVPGRVATSVQTAQLNEQPATHMAEAMAVETPAAANQDAPAAEQTTGMAPVIPGGDKNEALSRREEELLRKEQSLKTLEKEIDDKLVRLQQLEAKLSRMINEAQAIKDKKLTHLIDVYSNMKAKQAATVLETLDPDIAVKILAGMRGRQAGEILTNVKADKAARLTEMLTKMQVPFE